MDEDILKSFESYLLNEKGRSPLTAKNYLVSVSLFQRYLMGQSLTKVILDNIRGLILVLQTGTDGSGKNKHSASSVQAIVSAIKTFYDFATDKKFIATNPITSKINLPSPKRKESAFLDPEELSKFIKFVDKLKGRNSIRDCAIIHLLAQAGLRLREVVSLNKNSINFKTREVKFIGKGGHEAILNLHSEITDAIKKWFDIHPVADPSYALFVTNTSRFKIRRISPSNIQHIVKVLINRCGITKNIHPHSLRHSYGTWLASNPNNEPVVIQGLMRHSSLATTTKYLHLGEKRAKTVIDSMPPLGEEKK
ncbi:MAG: tyrosine-type recombinase/integrase [Caldisericia bacterium]